MVYKKISGSSGPQVVENLVVLPPIFEIYLGSKVEIRRLISGDNDATIVFAGSKMVLTGAGLLNYLGVGL